MKFYAIYDEKDFIVGVFEKLSEVADWFGTSKDCISCAITRKNLKTNKKTGGKFRIFKFED